MADQDQVSIEPAVAVERASGFDGGAEFVVGTDQGERGGRGEELGVGGRSKELVGVLRVQRFTASRQRNDFDSPEAAGKIGRAEHTGDAFLQRFNGCGQQRRPRAAAP